MMLPGEKGGVEEKKEDTMDNLSPSMMLRNRQSSDDHVQNQQADEIDEEQTYGFHARLQRIANAIFGSCGQLIEAASCFVSQQGCRWPMESPVNQQSAQGAAQKHHRPPLSIAEELRKLAQEDGNRNFFQPLQGFRRTDIPKFLGEEAVYSFDDDNISAISQHTLEEMARNGVVQAHYPGRKKSSNPSPPSPTETNSSDSSVKPRENPPRQQLEQTDGPRVELL
jgi:hypothetical protein